MTFKTVQKISCNLATSTKEDHPRKKVILNFRFSCPFHVMSLILTYSNLLALDETGD